MTMGNEVWMDGTPGTRIWMDGTIVDWGEARVHILTHTLHYGLGLFEGIRCYKTPRGPAIFRLPEHVSRLFEGAQIIGMQLPFSEEQITSAIKQTVHENALEECYIRPLVYVGYGKLGLNPLGIPIRVAIAAWPWGAYLGEEGLASGIRVRISSFTRHHPNIMMTKAKVVGNYANSQLAKVEAVQTGYDEALLLDPAGYVAEGSGENVFIARHGVLKTPPLMSILGASRAPRWLSSHVSKASPCARNLCLGTSCISPMRCSSPAQPPRSPRCVRWISVPSAPANRGLSPSDCSVNFSTSSMAKMNASKSG